MQKTVIICFFLLAALFRGNAQLVVATKTNLDLVNATIVVDDKDFDLVKKAATLLQQDIEAVTGKKISISNKISKSSKNNIVLGTITNSGIIQHLVSTKKIGTANLTNKWEGYQILTVGNNLVIAGSDKRGVTYGVFELSRQMGVSPWYWWADVSVKKQSNIFINTKTVLIDAPKVKYRGIFLNDEAPALSNWSKEKFGGFNHKFYEKVFELMLRLKSNYIWPAMWGNAFYDDDSLNINMANEYGIVIGTSHHEPLMRAHDEWRRHGKDKWNYDSNEVRLKEFWKEGMQRATNEKIVTVGMRGDGDEPMSRETATSLLERIVTDQRKIINEVTGKPAEQTPQLWALYKEVQDYYDKGMRVPDDVTLLLCDDNWGNIRRLPDPNEKTRKGGYGIYYHFDYVGGPRNYKWINTNHISRIWEQMHLAYQYNAKEIWIVNVGDLKPMEFPISFFLDYAWNPDAIGADDLQKYTEEWCAMQFGDTFFRHSGAEPPEKSDSNFSWNTYVIKDIADVLNRYTKMNSRRKHELLDANTFSVETGEWQRVTDEYYQLYRKADAIRKVIPSAYQDAYYQLVLHPVQASSNLYRMYHAVAMNRFYAQMGDTAANRFAREARQFYANDSAITIIYHKLNNGKWNHMMSQTHIGYTYWQQPPVNRMPATEMVSMYNLNERLYKKPTISISAKEKIPVNTKGNVFFEQDGYASMHADHFTRKNESSTISWKVYPDHGRIGNAITTWPVTHAPININASSPWLEYDLYTYSKDTMQLQFLFSPTLNFLHAPEGFQFEVIVNNSKPQILTINKKDYDGRTWEGWVASNVIKVSSLYSLTKEGKQTIRYRPLFPGMVLQNILANMGGLQPDYLGPKETMVHN